MLSSALALLSFRSLQTTVVHADYRHSHNQRQQQQIQTRKHALIFNRYSPLSSDDTTVYSAGYIFRLCFWKSLFTNHHNNGSSKKKKKKNMEYELNINLNYHIGSHIMTKLNRLHLRPWLQHDKTHSSVAVLANKRHNTLLQLTYLHRNVLFLLYRLSATGR